MAEAWQDLFSSFNSLNEGRHVVGASNGYQHADDGLVRTTCKVKVGEFNPKYTILSVYHAGDHYKIMVRLGFER